MADVLSSFWSHLPTPIHSANPIAGVAAAVTEADSQFRTGVHYSAEHKGGKGNGAFYQVSYAVGQMITGRPLLDDVGSALVD